MHIGTRTKLQSLTRMGLISESTEQSQRRRGERRTLEFARTVREGFLSG